MGDLIPLFRSTAFDPDAIKALGEAYDTAIALLSGARPLESRNDFIARWIVWLGQQGERDVARLRERALKQLERETRQDEMKLHHEFLRKVFASSNGISVRIGRSQIKISESVLLLDRIDKQLQARL